MPKSDNFTAYWTYALAFLGAHLAFMPLFVLLLPRRVEVLAPEDTASWLSWLLLTGGVVAGLANVAAGAVGDRWLVRFGNRRGLIAIGAVLLSFAYLGLAVAGSVAALFVAIIFFQIALNCCFSPLGALLADHFPDEVKGRLGGLMTAAHPASTLLVLPIAWLLPEDGASAFLLTGAVSIGCMLPLLAHWKLGPVISASRVDAGPVDAVIDKAAPVSAAPLLFDFSLAWLSRLLVQTGAVFVISYIYLYIALMQDAQASWQNTGASEILAALTTPAAVLAISVTLLSGYISDRGKSRRVPLFAFACLFGIGMGILAGSTLLVWVFIGYGLLHAALSAYLGVDTALVAQLVSGNANRGFLLGIMNLSNTFPLIIVPTIALVLFADGEAAGTLASMFVGFAIAAGIAGVLVLLIRSVK